MTKSATSARESGPVCTDTHALYFRGSLARLSPKQVVRFPRMLYRVLIWCSTGNGELCCTTTNMNAQGDLCRALDLSEGFEGNVHRNDVNSPASILFAPTG